MVRLACALMAAALLGGCRCALFQVPGPDAETTRRLDALETWQKNMIEYENAVRSKVEDNEQQLDQLRHDVDSLHDL